MSRNIIEVNCDNCNQPFSVLSGEKWECPNCGVVKEVIEVVISPEGKVETESVTRKEAK